MQPVINQGELYGRTYLGCMTPSQDATAGPCMRLNYSLLALCERESTLYAGAMSHHAAEPGACMVPAFARLSMQQAMVDHQIDVCQPWCWQQRPSERAGNSGGPTLPSDLCS